MKKKLVPALAALAFGIGLICKKTIAFPYEWLFLFLAFGVGFALLSAHARGNLAKYACITLMSLFLALFGLEFMLGRQSLAETPETRGVPFAEIMKGRAAGRDAPAASAGLSRDQAKHPPAALQDRPHKENAPDDGYGPLMPFASNNVNNDPVLGSRPVPKKTRTVNRVTHNGEIVYEVVYSTLDSGWRVTPQHPDADVAIVFFGCSFTFGEGLSDDQTFAWLVGEGLGPRCQVFNFAYHGYGSHHMLAQIEDGYLDDIVKKYKKVYVFYTTINGHEPRCAGFNSWDPHGPWFEMENGLAVRKGGFSDRYSPLRKALNKLLRNCVIHRKLVQPKEKDIPEYAGLHVGIIKTSDAILKKRYGLPLHVLVWPGATFLDLIQASGLDYQDLSPCFPDGRFLPDFALSPYDAHPNAKAARLVADAILERLRALGQP